MNQTPNMEWIILRITITITITIILLLSTARVLHSNPSTSTTSTTTTKRKRKRVGVIVSQGFELLDALGPYEALKEVQEHYYSNVDIEQRTWKKDGDSGIQCNSNNNNNNYNNDNNGGDSATATTTTTATTHLEVEVYLASFETNSVQSSSGVPLVPGFDLSVDPEANYFDLLVLGAGSLGQASYTDPATKEMEYVKHHHDQGGSIMTVCTGASYAARLGLLDGATATTHSLFLDQFRVEYPNTRWISLADHRDRRFVRSTDTIVTTAGITAGIDGILDQIEGWCGWEVAEATRQCLEWPLSIETKTNTQIQIQIE